MTLPTSCIIGHNWDSTSTSCLWPEKLKPREIASLLVIKQPEDSHLMNQHFSRFTADKALEFLKRLDQTVSIRIRPHRPVEPYQEVGFAM